MPTLYILCGIPGSGKTTLSTELAETIGCKIYHFDERPGAFSPTKHEAAHREMWKDISQDLADGHDVICDDVHGSVKTRRDILDAITSPCKKVVIVMTTPLEECLVRNANRERRLPDFVLHHIHSTFEPPSLDEGWDDIIYY